MNNEEYKKLVNSVIERESIWKNLLVSFVSGGFMGLLGEYLSNKYISLFNISLSDSYLYVFITFILIGSILTGIGVFDKILSFFKCGLIVPCTGFANSMTSSAMDYNTDGFVRGIGSSIFKLTGSIILYGTVFGIIFGFIRGVLL